MFNKFTSVYDYAHSYTSSENCDVGIKEYSPLPHIANGAMAIFSLYSAFGLSILMFGILKMMKNPKVLPNPFMVICSSYKRQYLACLIFYLTA